MNVTGLRLKKRTCHRKKICWPAAPCACALGPVDVDPAQRLTPTDIADLMKRMK